MPQPVELSEEEWRVEKVEMGDALPTLLLP